VAQDYAKARDWYEKAAAKDNAGAMVQLGLFYAHGQGGAQDYAKAREWFEKAAPKDNAMGMAYLGILYENGQGVPQDYIKAREWYEKAAAKDSTDAMFNLGVLYQNGKGVTQDYVKARGISMIARLPKLPMLIAKTSRAFLEKYRACSMGRSWQNCLSVGVKHGRGAEI
jgi:TPR repeat protein